MQIIVFCRASKDSQVSQPTQVHNFSGLADSNNNNFVFVFIIFLRLSFIESEIEMSVIGDGKINHSTRS